MMSDYTLYMDESETFNSAGNRYFVMSGVIIPTMGCQLIIALDQELRCYGKLIVHVFFTIGLVQRGLIQANANRLQL